MYCTGTNTVWDRSLHNKFIPRRRSLQLTTRSISYHGRISARQKVVSVLHSTPKIVGWARRSADHGGVISTLVRRLSVVVIRVHLRCFTWWVWWINTAVHASVQKSLISCSYFAVFSYDLDPGAQLTGPRSVGIAFRTTQYLTKAGEKTLSSPRGWVWR